MPRAEAPQGTLGAHGVGPLEDPVLPGGQPAEDLGLHGLGPGEAEVGLHAREGVRREAGALLEREPHLVVPVDLVRRERSPGRPRRPLAASRSLPIRARAAVEGLVVRPRTAVASRLRPLAIGNQPSFAAVRRRCAAGRSVGVVPSSMNDRSAARASSASRPAKQLPGSISATRVRAERSRRFERAGPVEADLPHQPVVGPLASTLLGGQDAASGRRCVRSTHVPISGSLRRSRRKASSSSRAAASSQAEAPASSSSSGRTARPRSARGP